MFLSLNRRPKLTPSLLPPLPPTGCALCLPKLPGPSNGLRVSNIPQTRRWLSSSLYLLPVSVLNSAFPPAGRYPPKINLGPATALKTVHLPSRGSYKTSPEPADKGPACLFLNEKCFQNVTRTGQVKRRMRSLQELAHKSCRLSILEAPFGPWLFPLLGPLMPVFLVMRLIPSLFRLSQEGMGEISQWSVNQVLTKFPQVSCHHLPA